MEKTEFRLFDIKVLRKRQEIRSPVSGKWKEESKSVPLVKSQEGSQDDRGDSIFP
jgi:hypothetical protein